MSERRELPNIPWVRVRDERGLRYLEKQLKDTRYNESTDPTVHKDRNKSPLCFLYYNYKPDSEWSKGEKELHIWFATPELATAGFALVKKHMKD